MYYRMSYKLKSITPSNKEGKKLMAVFINKATNREKTTHFGAKGYDDYLITKDKEQRTKYRKRHLKDLKTNDPTRAGYLSRFILWGNSTSLQKNISSYKKRFKL